MDQLSFILQALFNIILYYRSVTFSFLLGISPSVHMQLQSLSKAICVSTDRFLVLKSVCASSCFLVVFQCIELVLMVHQIARVLWSFDAQYVTSTVQRFHYFNVNVTVLQIRQSTRSCYWYRFGNHELLCGRYGRQNTKSIRKFRRFQNDTISCSFYKRWRATHGYSFAATGFVFNFAKPDDESCTTPNIILMTTSYMSNWWLRGLNTYNLA